MEVARTVTVIPAKNNSYQIFNENRPIKKRVAAYARVSTDFDEQISSFEAQRDYYINHIKSKPEWNFVGVYTDEGISATSTKNRDGFNKMIEDALNGKIDLIITKSVPRFARNTVDTLMSSLAQEESRSISENVTWGHRKRFLDGKVSLPYGQ